MSVRCGQGSASRQRPWCWHVATFLPPFFRLLASGWECWRTPLAPWRSWETSGPSTTVSKWSSSWAVAPLSPTARQKWTGKTKGRERETCRDTVHNHLLHDKSSQSTVPHFTWRLGIQSDLFSQSDRFQTAFSSRTVPYPTQTQIQEALVGGGVFASPQKSATPHVATEGSHHSSLWSAARVWR